MAARDFSETICFWGNVGRDAHIAPGKPDLCGIQWADVGIRPYKLFRNVSVKL